MKRSTKKLINVFDSPDLSFLEDEKISPTVKINDSSDIKWVKEFRSYIKMLLGKIIDNIPGSPKGISSEEKEDILHCLLKGEDGKNIRFFAYGVTSLAVNPNEGKNYETYEMVGDKFLGCYFAMYLRRRYEKITESELTNNFQKIMATKYQARISSGMGLDTWGILPYTKEFGMLKPNMPFKEDMLESFIGVIATVLEREGKVRYIGDVVLSFLSLIFDKREFNVGEQYKELDLSNITYVQQYFSAVVPFTDETGNIIEKVETIEGDRGTSYKFEVYQGKEVIDYIKKEYKIAIKPLLGRAIHKSKKESKSLAYTQARDMLEQYGMDRDFKEEVKKNRNNLDQKNNMEDLILAKAKKDGYDIEKVEIYIWSNENYTVVNFHGVYKDGEKEVIYRKIYENTKDNTSYILKENAYKSYVKSKKF